MTEVFAWLRRQAGDFPNRFGKSPDDRAEREALAARLRRELGPLEAALEQAAERLEQATQEEADAGLALAGREAGKCPTRGTFADADPEGVSIGTTIADPHLLDAARKRLQYAKKGRELAGLAFGIARARVNFTSGALFQLEKELAETT